MTFLEKFKVDQGSAVKGYIRGMGCPSSYGYEKDEQCGLISCEKCWNREMPDTESLTEKEKMIDFMSENAYNKGLNDAWELLKKLEVMNVDKLREVFGFASNTMQIFEKIYNNFTPQEALAKLKEYEEAQIEVGDVVEGQMSGKKAIVTRTDGSYLDVITNEGGIDCWDKEVCKKTGKHIDIQSILEQIGE